MVASVMTAMVVGAASLGLRATGSLISHSGDKATLRQNTVNGLRLMRSEIERSIHLVLNNSGQQIRQDKTIKRKLAETLSQCTSLAGANICPILWAPRWWSSPTQSSMASTNVLASGYSILRCDAHSMAVTTKQKSSISTILEDIGSMPCEPMNVIRKSQQLPEPRAIHVQNGFSASQRHEPALRDRNRFQPQAGEIG